MKYVLLAVLALAACVPDEPLVGKPGPLDETRPTLTVVPPLNETSLGPDFSKMDWTLNLVDGKPAGYNATLNLGVAGQMSGQGPCNAYSASLKNDGKNFVPGLIIGTLMACENLAQEDSFFNILKGITTIERGEGHMTLRGGGHELAFVQPVN